MSKQSAITYKEESSDQEIIEVIPVSTINSVFSEHNDYMIVALTGKVGSGCSLVSSYLQDTKKCFPLTPVGPGLGGYASDKDRGNSILLQYCSKNLPNFTLIRVRDVIASFLLEGDSLERLLDYVHIGDDKNSYDKLIKKITDAFQKNIWTRCRAFIDAEKDEFETEDLKQSEQLLDAIDKEKKSSKGCIEVLRNYNNAIFSNSTSEQESTTAQGENENLEKAAPLFVQIVLPEFATSIRGILGKNYTFAFQDFGNELRYFGSLEKDHNGFRKEMREKANFNYRATGHKNNKTMFTIAERINVMIKKIRKPYGKKRPATIVIDSMKNKYESNFLRDRYSAYYLFAVSREEDMRIKQLLKDERKSLSQDDIDIIDYNERPGQAAKSIIGFARCLRQQYTKEISHISSANKEEISDISSANKEEIVKYLQAIEDKNQNILFDYCIGINKQKLTNALKAEDENLRNYLNGNIEGFQKIAKEAGLTLALCKYCYSILSDSLRILLYINNLFPFYLQDVEACIQNADIFLTNNEPDDGPKNDLKVNLLRYIALMLHPGLLTPTPVERCMQIAYTAKANSGCISRQVGAVVTDKDYNILSLGWNDVPCGQTPCLYRNLLDLREQKDKGAYSDYEWSKDSVFQKYLESYDFKDSKKLVEILPGLSGSFCFKTLNEDVTNEKNPMNSRAMHGEEKALLQCDKERAAGGYLFTTSSPCEMCAKNAKEHWISLIYYIEPYPGISQNHVCNSGIENNRARYVLFEGAIGRAYTQLYTPVLPYKDELTLRGFPKRFRIASSADNETQHLQQNREKSENEESPLKSQEVTQKYVQDKKSYNRRRKT